MRVALSASIGAGLGLRLGTLVGDGRLGRLFGGLLSGRGLRGLVSLGGIGLCWVVSLS